MFHGSEACGYATAACGENKQGVYSVQFKLRILCIKVKGKHLIFNYPCVYQCYSVFFSNQKHLSVNEISKRRKTLIFPIC